MNDATNTKAPRNKTTFEIRWIDENTYDATVKTAAGKMFVRTYGGEKPTEEGVKSDWKDEPRSFRQV